MSERDIKLHFLMPLMLSAATVLSACGGSDSNNTDNTLSAAQPTPTPEATPASVTIEAPAIVRSTTLMGSTFTVDGDATVVTDSSGTIENQNKAGFSLYIFDNDTVGTSNCNSAECIASWPPFVAAENAMATSPFSIIQRDDGNNQWALRGKPLYFFSSDAAAGDVNGEGVGGVWHVAITEPVLFSPVSLNTIDSVYLIASGQVNVALPSVAGDNTAFNSVSTDMQSRSLYTFDNDTANVSNCNGGCLASWPALLADENDVAVAPYSIIERSMGGTATARQWAYHGQPLYFFSGDTIAGETNGKDIANWRLARPLSFTVSETPRADALTGYGLTDFAQNTDSGEAAVSQPNNGFALYTFDNDSIDTASACENGCLDTWPAFLAPANADPVAPYSVIARNSGLNQWALNGSPLYFFANDNAPGDVNGDGVGGVWHLARPAPVATVEQSQSSLMLTGHGNIVNGTGESISNFDDFTLYTFDNDTATGLSTCFGGCATTWPPLYAPASATDFGNFTVILRDDPATTAVEAVPQWAYKGQPLYFFANDTQPGDTNGDGVGGVWHIARP